MSTMWPPYGHHMATIWPPQGCQVNLADSQALELLPPPHPPPPPVLGQELRGGPGQHDRHPPRAIRHGSHLPTQVFVVLLK